MLKEIRNGLLAGLGGVLLTREKIEGASRKLVEDAKLSKEDAEKLTQELVDRGEKQYEQMEKSLKKALQKGLTALDLDDHSEIQNLKSRLTNLENRVSILETISKTEKRKVE